MPGPRGDAMVMPACVWCMHAGAHSIPSCGIMVWHGKCHTLTAQEATCLGRCGAVRAQQQHAGAHSIPSCPCPALACCEGIMGAGGLQDPLFHAKPWPVSVHACQQRMLGAILSVYPAESSPWPAPALYHQELLQPGTCCLGEPYSTVHPGGSPRKHLLSAPRRYLLSSHKPPSSRIAWASHIITHVGHRIS